MNSQKIDSSDEQLLTPAEAAKIFHVSPITIRHWANTGVLNAVVTPGGHRRFRLGDVLALAEANSTTAPYRKNHIPKVLIIDDDQDINELLSNILKKHFSKIETITATNGFEGGSLTQEHLPDLIFLDIKMPGIQGDTVCQYIKKKKTIQHIPIIGITGFATPENIKVMKDAGAVDVLLKPFNTAKLVALVTTVLPLNIAK